MNNRPMTIKALARASGETAETIRLCEREGILRRASEDSYDETALAVLRLVRIGMQLRISLEEVKIAALALHTPSSLNAALRNWALRRLAHIAREQDDLRVAQTTLSGFLSRSQLPQAADPERGLQDLARLHRDLVGASETARAAKDRRAPTPSPRAPSVAKPRTKTNGAAGPPATRDEAERSEPVRFVL